MEYSLVLESLPPVPVIYWVGDETTLSTRTAITMETETKNSSVVLDSE